MFGATVGNTAFGNTPPLKAFFDFCMITAVKGLIPGGDYYCLTALVWDVGQAYPGAG